MFIRILFVNKNFAVEGATYSDICYKPLGEFNSTHPMQDCATISVFQVSAVLARVRIETQLELK